ncbi:NAD(P)/FAD-dependent oxidoreductase [Robertkochia solimangrovi]|uniref:NAD(P)/FAD-dependent oxidoreductase n=1 Tax=Robertkochia solimangrovi TaxID=2213046 RepID=UPI00117F5D27|nr:FAD/NAD(P)-binding oxidoreductase [Robertkochia solimangrovi]TRZ43491.1 NAD(P)/FAD-dependent oxidoreductase [Robertkochia solimangrovi]
MKNNHQVLIIGGGTAGIMTAARLRKADPSMDIAIIEPSDTHYYQPAWTLVGAGTYDFKNTAKPMAGLIPAGVTWVKDYATAIDAENRFVDTLHNGKIGYEYLIVAPGLVMRNDLIEGLEEAIDKGVVCSNYTDPEHTWEVLKNFKGGNAIFTQPATPIKCGGAPQKIAYLAADYLKQKNLLKDTNMIFATPGTVIFGVPEIKETLENVIRRYGINFKPFHTPVKIDGKAQIAYFKNTTPEGNSEGSPEGMPGAYVTDEGLLAVPFNLLHLAPPQAAPEFILKSSLVNESGWLDVDIHSLQHKKYPEVFGLGDVAGLPTAKTGAAVRKQVPVVVDNLLKLMQGKKADNMAYNGYSSCPLVTAKGKMVLAEFDYNNKFTPDPKLKQMLITDSSKEHWRLWILKKYILPYLYWNKMMKGVDV